MNADITQTTTVFERMEAHGWDTSKPLKWGFFFMSGSPDALEAVWAEVSGHNYTRESLHQADDGPYVLQISKVEPLTCDKLHRRNIAFNELAEHCGPVSYDGWDVGRAG